ncbi:MAG TPA: hypothetical protein VGQ58_00675 [Candidatus Limnocylindrales bacterium]|jgi:hypothetical protein|nr:hypothetical protein [Candidatus Limnocylindrales bacterium]
MRALLLRCYPARWRARYGDEFAEILAERPLGPFDVADVVLGALDAHLHLRGLGAASEHGRGFAMSLRIGGIAALFGGVLWFIGIAGSSATEFDGLFASLALIATASLLVAMIGLSAFQARAYPRLIWLAFGIPALGAVISLVGYYGMATVGDGPFLGDVSPWYVWMIGTLLMIMGSGLFAFATWRASSLSRGAAAVLVAAAVGVLILVPNLMGVVSFIPEALGPLASIVALGAFGAGWSGLGLSALRMDRAALAAIGGASS